MHEVRVESLDKLESLGGEVWISANSGDVNIVFPKNVWEEVLSKVSETGEPEEAELEELRRLKKHLRAFAKENDFETVLEDAPRDELSYDLVLRSSEPYAVTTGYLFARAVGRQTIETVRAALDKDPFVEQAYVLGAVAEDEALAGGDEDVKVLSVRGRQCTASRFEMSPELWRTLADGLGWKDTRTVIPEEKKG